jgi:plasmid stabilization system protein ParE
VARTVVWTHRAWSDLERAADYIAQDSPSYAAALVSRTREAARSLTHFAERGRLVPELEEPQVRELLVDSFRLIYQVGRVEIAVLAFVHGARDLSGLVPPPSSE